MKRPITRRRVFSHKVVLTKSPLITVDVYLWVDEDSTKVVSSNTLFIKLEKDVLNIQPTSVALKKSDFVPELYVERQGWDPEIAKQYADTLMEMEEGSTNRVFPLRVPGVFQFNSAVATATSKALAGQLSPQEALDEAAADWKKIVKRIGADTIREAYAIGVALEDNL